MRIRNEAYGLSFVGKNKSEVLPIFIKTRPKCSRTDGVTWKSETVKAVTKLGKLSFLFDC